MVVYDVSNKASFDHVQQWMDEIKEYDVPKLLVGNKTDKPALISSQEGKAKADILGTILFIEVVNKLLEIGFVETSAESAQNVEEVFKFITRQIKEKAAVPNKY
jgi:GTPase SAR1 family protein